MVFVTETLTKSSRILLGHARRFRKENNWKYAWVKNGIIRISKSDDSLPIVIECVENLEKYSKKLLIIKLHVFYIKKIFKSVFNLELDS